MPTQHVKPDSHDTLQEIANALLKARKVVVVTGAGISTNSGIPDFRSENGLYSLIQAQFDAAAQQTRQGEEDHPLKRRRVSREASPDVRQLKDETSEEPILPAVGDDADAKQHDSLAVPDALRTPRPKPPLPRAIQLATSPLSSPPEEEFMRPPSSLRLRTHKRLADVSRAVDSSPLSSPPPVLFDPFQPASPCCGESPSSRRTSSSSSSGSTTVASEAEENQASASQTSNQGRINLPNMKGKDLFDASIWADPTRTSVFYKFATSLRQKVKEAEPTSSHKFISHLRDRGKLVRCYTQNIDQIEEKVGLSTSLQDGPGSRGRFSRKHPTPTSSQSLPTKTVEGASGDGGDGSEVEKPQKPSQDNDETAETSGASCGHVDAKNEEEHCSSSSSSPQPPLSSAAPSGGEVSTSTTLEAAAAAAAAAETAPSSTGEQANRTLKREASRSGVECVFLHGSLELLRCFQCGRVCSWDDGHREMETLSGQQPECPHCVGATEARRERGKRALGVGKLRPDIVLYGEEHPNAHLISPIVTHDLALCPDMLLILGTSLRVHGLKVMVREFAKAAHSRGGKVVFVNFTKPPESSWGDMIDYWIQWDCDAWVADLRERIPKLWQAPEPPRAKKEREDKKRPLAANPVALRDTKFTGAYCTLKILKELHRITSQPATSSPSLASSPLPRRPASMAKKKKKKKKNHVTEEPRTAQEEKPKRSRARRTCSTLNPNHGRSVKKQEDANPPEAKEISSILLSVKAHPRIRKRKVIDGEEVPPPTAGRRRNPPKATTQLPPLRPESAGSSAEGPLATLSVNMRAAMKFARPEAFYIEDPLVKLAPSWPAPRVQSQEEAEANAALALAGLRTGRGTGRTVVVREVWSA